MKRFTTCIALALLLAFGGIAVAETPDIALDTTPPPTKRVVAEDGTPPLFFFEGVLQSLFVYKNDEDFDSTAPYYDAHGQSLGLLGTFLKPRLTFAPVPYIRVVYETELGLALWSLHDPDQYVVGTDGTFRFAHRELFVEGDLFRGAFGFKVGYQYFTDPTALFLGHWIGAASVSTQLGNVRLTATGGQMPDQTHEGVTLDSNNFTHDTFVYGLRADVLSGPLTAAVGVLGLHDAQVVGQTLDLVTLSARVRADFPKFSVGLDLAGQWGITQNGAQGGDEETLAWALQAFGEARLGPFELELNTLLLSADDGDDRNGSNHAFFYSAKPRSRTIILSEDEIRDRGFNIDEQMAVRRGKLYVVRPGLSLTDICLAHHVLPFFTYRLIVGGAFALESANALGSSFVGVETTLDLELRYEDILSFHIAGAALLPGGAAAAYLNLYDRRATETQFMVQASLFTYF